MGCGAIVGFLIAVGALAWAWQTATGQQLDSTGYTILIVVGLVLAFIGAVYTQSRRVR
jgi:hypothetical protein